jgi:hypothetical protein
MALSFLAFSYCVLFSVILAINYTKPAEGISSHKSKFNTIPLIISPDENNFASTSFRHDNVEYLKNYRIKEEALEMLMEKALQLLENSILINNSSTGTTTYVMNSKKTDLPTPRSDSTVEYIHQLLSFVRNPVISVELPKESETGRLIFFKGFKKLMWPVLFGIQMVKLTLFAIFLPSILGSLGKIVGKGLSQVSSFTNHAEPVDDLEFRDNYENLENIVNNGNDNGYLLSDSATANSFMMQMYEPYYKGAEHQNGNHREKINSPFAKYSKKHMHSKKDNFNVFQDIPSSSLLLANYDPFYSPLLSRLDAVFQQLSLQNNQELCREKLVCLMYANPAKFAPYSNLVSAQLSRELNELKRPTTDNPHILRFFKYMKAAKDGQDGVSCEQTYECNTLENSSNPAMINTFNDINKLVHARLLQS